MLPNILIVIGTIFTILGFIGLLALNISPFFRAIRVIFFHSIDDLVYDSAEGRTALDRAYKTLKKSFAFFFTIGLLFLLPGLWLKYAPRGNDSLLSAWIDGADAGNDDNAYRQEDSGAAGKDKEGAGKDGEAQGRDDKGWDGSYCIVIKEKTIVFNGQEIGGTKEFEDYLEGNALDRRQKVLLVDDYAVSLTYHEVMELLDAKGMNYETESDE